ncbi:MAG: ABC transporter permease [Candidatus Symbiothrix sp.]|jgi:lipoprotein-releasing system permease protein|nr:ABC transporter permease [Candidatus Symbiothrix sp.]
MRININNNFRLFFAQRLYFLQAGKKRISPPAIRVAIISMALGLAVMILSIAIVIGFKKEVRNKVIGFGSHIQITHFDNNSSYETQAISFSDSLLQTIRALPEVRHIQPFATKPVILKTDEAFQSVIFKGIDDSFDLTFLRDNLVEGEILPSHPDSSKTNVVISKLIADRLQLKLGDSFLCYFVQDPPRVRKYRIAGIYQTNFTDYDKLYMIGDIGQIRRVSDWDDDMVSGLEILVNDYDHVEQLAETLYSELITETDRMGNHYYVRSIREINPMIFAWLDVLDTNVAVILVLMWLVAGFSMISGLLIIILEHANLIGMLKAMGENNSGIRRIFLYIAVFIIGKGMFWGNVIALALCFVQKITGWIKLNPETYYLSEVPIDLNITSLILINIGTLIITLLMLLAPSYIVANITPAKTIRFE